MLAFAVRNKRLEKDKKELGNMLPETRTLLEYFYKDYNTELAAMFPYIVYNKQNQSNS